MQTLQAATDHYLLQQKISVSTVSGAKKLWNRMGSDFDTSWRTIRPEMLTFVQTGRMAAAVSAASYTPQLLAETGQALDSVGQIIPAAFVAYAPDGRAMESLLDTAVIRSKMAVAGGATATEALSAGGKWLTGTLLTVMSDTGRSVVSADIIQRPKVGGYVRMLNTPSCSRCVILAGKWFRWNEGFQRHPKCDCIHVPAATEKFAKEQGYVSDPYEYFKSLSVKDQERLFGKNEAEAIREFGADIYRVMNVKMRGLGTTKGNIKFGTPTKRTVDDILSRDPSRQFAVENLQYHGYITGPQVTGGNILGRYAEGFGQLGKGGNARAASDAIATARATGLRDPLNRYTMTAAERRLYDAKYKLDQARLGIYPSSVGQNSADIYAPTKTVTPEQLAIFEGAYANEIAKLPTASPSVLNLARVLGIL